MDEDWAPKWFQSTRRTLKIKPASPLTLYTKNLKMCVCNVRAHFLSSLLCALISPPSYTSLWVQLCAHERACPAAAPTTSPYGAKFKDRMGRKKIWLPPPPPPLSV